jgi:L-fuculose-phosphate aldolase
MEEPADPRERLVFYYRLLRRYGLNDSHSGNASLREGQRLWVTPTGACADTLQPADLIECRLDGTPPEGATLDAPLHLAVYRANPQAQAVLHSHGPYSVAMTLHGSDFEPVDFEGQYYFGRIPVIDIAHADYLSEAPAAVAEVLKAHKITVVRGHGVYAQGESLNRAYKWTASFELSAKTAWLARALARG